MVAISLHHVRFAATDLERTEAFARDFGLHTVSRNTEQLIMRTSGGDSFCYIAELAPERGFRGFAFTVADREVLEAAVARHGASAIRELDTPGGGWGVTLTDPEGLQVDLVTGIAAQPRATVPDPVSLNFPDHKARLHAAQNTPVLGPATLFRLGHVGLYVKDFATMAAWYQEVLGMRLSDTLHVPHQPDQKIVGFLRVDRGPDLVDHHTLFFGQFGKTDCHHVSFEMQDFEAQFIAHRWLEKQGWEANWGVGRHPLGSHVFDVWFDPDRYRWETFSDTDVLDASQQPGNHDIHESQMDIWSSDPPDRYFQ
jgi:catechol 2,3-dioxygenase-like lactoylglutathione lyase family enzyme